MGKATALAAGKSGKLESGDRENTFLAVYYKV